MLQMRKHRQKTKIKKKRKKERNKNNQSINQLAQAMLLSKGISPIVILPFYSSRINSLHIRDAFTRKDPFSEFYLFFKRKLPLIDEYFLINFSMFGFLSSARE
jgi:hypothetical protein